MILHTWIASVLTAASQGIGAAQDAIALREEFVPGYQYRVQSRVELSGKLTLPPAKEGSAPQSLTLTGHSAVDYDERVLATDKGHVHKTVRLVQRLEFQRKIGDEVQQASLRPGVRRLVVLRHGAKEVPFSPDGPLQWSEIELVRTDTFSPALTGLLPPGALRPGERWQASAGAVQELTDLERIDDGQVTCTLEAVVTQAKRRHARVAVQGTVRGLGEDGPARHQLDGFFLFDLESNHLSYLSLKGTHFLIDAAGKEAGKVEGTFVLTRHLGATAREIADEALRGVALEPNEDNTQLLFDQPELGVTFLYPRRWRVAGVQGRQITLDDGRGHGLLLTVEPLARVPTGAQFLQEARTWLAQQKATILQADGPRVVQNLPRQIEQFALDAQMTGGRVWLDYWVLRQPMGGATVAARLAANDLRGGQRDVHRIVHSVQIVRQP